MIEHETRVCKSRDNLAPSEQLAWKIAEVAIYPVPVEPEVSQMIVNRPIDNAEVAAASLRRRPVVNARAQALCHPFSPGSKVLGCNLATRVSPE